MYGWKSILFGLYIVCAWLAMIITPSPKQGPSTILIGWEGGRGREVKWGTVRGEVA